MKSQNNADFEQLPPDLMLKINQLCDQFESELKRGSLPSITSYLAEVSSPSQGVILKELISLEIEHRSQQGKRPLAGDYLESFPNLDPKWLSDVIETTRAQNETAPAGEKQKRRHKHPHEMSLNEYRERLTKTGLLSERDLTELMQGLDETQRPQTAIALSDRLIQIGKLTGYQAHVISSGEDHPIQIGDYLILEPIGSGGMGTVYKAIHQRMKRIVALKVIRSDLNHVPDRLKRFEREVQTAARLSHPNVVTAYDAGEDQGIHYLICEYIDGESLTQLVRESGPLDFSDALNCILQVAHGLEYAHGRGVIHRDIKPANILVDDQGDLKILDMGLARLEQSSEDLLADGSQTQLTSSQFFMGTIDYMAPEQARNTRLADHRSDIYSLGCTFYFLLTSKPIYNGETIVERILAHKEQPIPRLSDLDQQIPMEFNSIFEKMLAKDPDDRYDSVPLLIKDLQQFNSEYLQNQTMKLPVKEGETKTPAPKNGADIPTEVLPVDSGLTVFSAANMQEEQQSRSAKNRLMLWGGIAGAAIILIGAFLWNPLGQHSVSSHSTVAEQNQQSASNSNNGKKLQQEYAQKMNLPVSDRVRLGAEEEPAFLEMMLIPPGEFLMGDSSQPQRAYDAAPHLVKISKPFYLGATEITTQQFRRFVNETKYETDAERNGGYGVENGNWRRSTLYSWKYVGELALEDQTPALSISWNDAVAFCKWLSDRTGNHYRLPTEAEWEYACRAGSQTAWFFGTDEGELEKYAWFSNNSGNRIYPAKLKLPNPYGLYDIYGNEWEWCQDFYSATYYSESPLENPTGPARGVERVQRGGGFKEPSSRLTSYTRGQGAPESSL
ncbi:bifunctional serine/threonine-protein kinase/formylglycine-generating enzyme family protein, partial [uncultured Gimesia sp.]|uniref:bifunctional serine/threonine-protein kinase/formylglycine-generating enzyme family protein n=1 Tax=uncultured Gimesia sp. TaxID=1678688 RepID=UPI00262C8408